MPAFNAEYTIGAAISGVLGQTERDVELIVVDDGSTDRTRQICEGYGDRISYIRTVNGGSSAARNVGLKAATGDFIALCDADDVLLPPYLDVNLRVWQEQSNQRAIVMNEALLLTAQGTAHGRRLIHGKFPRAARQRLAILQKNFVCIFTVFPRQLVDEIGFFDETLAYCEDWEFWIRAVLGGWEIVFQPTPHALYRWSPGAKSVQLDAYQAEDVIIRRAAETYGAGLADSERSFLRLRLQESAPRLLDVEGGEAVRRRDWGTARRKYRALATLSSQDRRSWAKAILIGYVPLAAPAWRMRQQRIDASVGRRELDRT